MLLEGVCVCEAHCGWELKDSHEVGGAEDWGEGFEVPSDTLWDKRGSPEALPSPQILVYLFIKLEV